MFVEFSIVTLFPGYERTVRMDRMQFSSTAVASFVLASMLTACDCGSQGDPPGPSHMGFEQSSAKTIAELGLLPFDVDRQDLIKTLAEACQKTGCRPRRRELTM